LPAVEHWNEPRKSGVTRITAAPRKLAPTLLEPDADTFEGLNQGLEGVNTMAKFHPGVGREADMEWALPVAAHSARSSKPYPEAFAAIYVQQTPGCEDVLDASPPS
jgi:hypothetical protein